MNASFHPGKQSPSIILALWYKLMSLGNYKVSPQSQCKSSSPVRTVPRFSSASATTTAGGKGWGWGQLRDSLTREVLWGSHPENQVIPITQHRPVGLLATICTLSLISRPSKRLAFFCKQVISSSRKQIKHLTTWHGAQHFCLNPGPAWSLLFWACFSF